MEYFPFRRPAGCYFFPVGLMYYLSTFVTEMYRWLLRLPYFIVFEVFVARECLFNTSLGIRCASFRIRRNLLYARFRRKLWIMRVLEYNRNISWPDSACLARLIVKPWVSKFDRDEINNFIGFACPHGSIKWILRVLEYQF